MAVSKVTVYFSCPVEKVWRTVTDLTNTAWRSDLARVAILDGDRFVEYTKSGYTTSFMVTACEPSRFWSFAMENNNMSGFWEGVFEAEGDSTRLTCTETITAKHWWMHPFVSGYLKRQQKRYFCDLRKELLK